MPHALIFPDVNEVELGEYDVGEPGPGEVRLRVLASGVSPGTEMRIMAGKEYGDRSFPEAAGYALCGEVEAVGEGVELAVGQRVVAQRHHGEPPFVGSHLSHAVCPAAGCVPVPGHVSDHAAALARVLSIGHRGARLAAPKVGETCAVIGLGIIGLAAALSLRLTGARVACFNRSADRVEVARACGLDAHAMTGDLAERVKEVLPGGADVLIDATGHPPTAAAAVGAIRDLGWDDGDRGSARYVVLGSQTGSHEVPYFPAFYRELSVLFPRYTDNRDAAEVVNLLASGAIDVGPLLKDAVFSPRDAAEVYAALRERRPGLVTAVFDWTSL